MIQWWPFKRQRGVCFIRLELSQVHHTALHCGGSGASRCAVAGRHCRTRSSNQKQRL